MEMNINIKMAPVTTLIQIMIPAQIQIPASSIIEAQTAQDVISMIPGLLRIPMIPIMIMK
jgi:hypothetical protein